MQSRSFFSLLFLLVSLLAIQGCSQTEPAINKISGPTMGTEYHVSWVSVYQSQAELAAERQAIQTNIDALLVGINKSMSTYDPQSELSLINSNYTAQWQEISEDLHRVMVMSMQVNSDSESAFDVTVGPLVNLWGFGPSERSEQAPAAEVIENTLNTIGSDVIHLRKHNTGYELKLDAPRYIDLSAIAKGYAVDMIGYYLENQNIQGYLAEVGGEILARGTKSSMLSQDSQDTAFKGKPWRIAIEAPNDSERTAQIVIPLSNMGIATSGDYRNFFEQKGQRYSHTLDGRTGYPVNHDLASVSVLHESVAMADAWATALTVLGVEKGLQIAEQLGLAAFFIQRTDTGFQQFSTSEFEQLR